MELKDLRKMSIEELDKLIIELKKELFALRFQLTIGQLEKTHQIKSTRRNAAKAITVRNELKAKAEKK